MILHGKHRSEREDGFDTSEFKRVFKLPQEVDPTAITSRATQNGDALIIEGTKRVEEKTEEGKFEAKFDFSGFKPEEIKIQLHGNELNLVQNQNSNRCLGLHMIESQCDMFLVKCA